MDFVGNKLLEVHPDTVMTIRKMYNLDKPGDMDKAVDALAEWLKKQQHLTKKEYSREYLERSIIQRKGSVERAKSQLDKLCSLRAIFPKMFEKHDARNDFNHVDEYFLNCYSPKLTKDHYRVYAAKFVKDGITNDILFDVYRLGILLSEYEKLYDYCNGYIAVFDFRPISLVDLISATDFVLLHRLIMMLMEGYGVRVKGIHAVTSSKAIEVLINMVKPMLGPKVGNRLHVHRNEESLYEHLPKDVLPSDFGGDQASIAYLSEQIKDDLGTKENIKHMKEMSEAVSNEAYRLKESLNGLDLGLAGTFRSLNVD